VTNQQRDNPQFYLTLPTPCPYLKGLKERKIFTHLSGDFAPALNDVLAQGGFRRSQSIAYHPACEGCSACISVRVLTEEFKPTRSMRRIRALNHDVLATEVAPLATSEQYSVFRAYIDSRHAEGGMADMSVLDYTTMIEDTHVQTQFIEYRAGPRLIACALTDILSNGLSMVYSFYEPDDSLERSLGTFMILDHIDRARKLKLPYLYLGYWVEKSPKMEYKSRFLPQERLTSKGWGRYPERG
jgi:arginine-tRNA-protein transferase